MSKEIIEYLWQCTGDADPWIVELEMLLAPLRYDAGSAPIRFKPAAPPAPRSPRQP